MGRTVYVANPKKLCRRCMFKELELDSLLLKCRWYNDFFPKDTAWKKKGEITLTVEKFNKRYLNQVIKDNNSEKSQW